MVQNTLKCFVPYKVNDKDHDFNVNGSLKSVYKINHVEKFLK